MIKEYEYEIKKCKYIPMTSRDFPKTKNLVFDTNYFFWVNERYLKIAEKSDSHATVNTSHNNYVEYLRGAITVDFCYYDVNIFFLKR